MSDELMGKPIVQSGHPDDTQVRLVEITAETIPHPGFETASMAKERRKHERQSSLASANCSAHWCEHIMAFIGKQGQVVAFYLNNPYMNHVSIPANWVVCPICQAKRPVKIAPNDQAHARRDEPRT